MSSDVPPAPPQNVIASGGNGQNSLSWGKADGATAYNLYWSKTSGVTKQTGTKIANLTSIYYHTGLTNETTYYYVVTAVNQYGESGESQEVSATPTERQPPLPPADVAVRPGDRQVIIRWSADEIGTVTSHNVYWSTSAGVTKQSGTKISGVANPYTHQGLTNDRTYYYAVTSVNAYGESLLSSEVSAVPQQMAPATPTGVSATAGDRQAVISWEADPGATSCNLYWSTSSDVSSKNGTKIAGVNSPYTHEGLTPDTTYYYVVTAVNGFGESPDSERASVFIPNLLRDVCVALGDSITTGKFVPYASSYVPRLAGNWGKTVYNEGRDGALSSYGASIIDHVLAEYNPKYITIFFGANDDGFYSPDWTISNLRRIIQAAKAYGTKPVIATLTPVFGQWAWRKPSCILLNQKIRQLADEEGITCADLEASFNWNSALILDDGLHPNSDGHRIIASKFHWALTH